MTTTIGDIELDRDMIFENEFNYSLIRSEATPTLGGGMVIQEFRAFERGRLIRLVSTDSQGMQKRSTVELLKTMSLVANQTFPFLIESNGVTFEKVVRFANEADGGAVQFVPFQDRQGFHSSHIWYKGSITLMVV